MNIEFIILIIDYLKTLKRRDFLFEWGVPIILCSIVYYINIDNKEIKKDAITGASGLISLLGILVGFSIAVITLLITSNTKNIEEIKKKLARNATVVRRVTLFDLLIITYIYAVVTEVVLLIFNLLFPSLMRMVSNIYYINILYTLDLFGVMHVLFVTIRNVTNFYLILVKK